VSATAFAARHSMDSPEWYSPSPYVEAAREVMGAIDLDPASHEEANETVKAGTFYTQESNGLMQPWFGRVFLNPPGGLVVPFWNRLMAHYADEAVSEAVWIGYSLEQLQTLQTGAVGFATPLDFTICIPNRRIAFVENGAKQAERFAKLTAAGKKPNPKSSPSHANYITYIGYHKSRFADVFAKFGQVVIR
jgi:hypothetical protein